MANTHPTLPPEAIRCSLTTCEEAAVARRPTYHIGCGHPIPDNEVLLCSEHVDTWQAAVETRCKQCGAESRIGQFNPFAN